MTDRPKSESLLNRHETWRAILTTAPGFVWIGAFLLLPLGGVLAVSFLSRGTYGQIGGPLTLDNFRRLFGDGEFGFDPVYLLIVVRSLIMAAATVALCIIASLPLAFFITNLPARWKNLALLLMIVPFWTNLLIRTYAWQIILSGTAWPARFAAALGFVRPGEALFPSTFAVLVGLMCDYLPFLALPLYASVEKIDWTLAEAASDLGANSWHIFRHAILPQVFPGLLAGSILVFIPASGQFIIPDLLGGAKTVLLGNAIQQQFGPSRDWPFGCAIACFAIVISLVGLRLFTRSCNETESER